MKRLEDINLDDKAVIVRCDLNVPMENGIITDDNRIIKSIPTIKYLYENAKSVVILSHLGRIKNKEDEKKNTLEPVCNYLSKKLNIDITFCTYLEDVKKVVSENKIVMLENTRFFDLDNNKESNNDLSLAKFFASLGDVFVNDAFGVSHRNATSVVGISNYLPSYMGFLVREEIEKLNIIRNNPIKPFTVILGGSKVKDKIGLITNLIDKVDNLVIVGGMAFTFLKAMNINIGKSILDTENIDYAKDILEKYGNKIVLPMDFYTNTEFSNNGNKVLRNVKDIKDNEIGLDIGPETIKLIENRIKNSKTVFVNGPAGAFELSNYAYGTKEIFEILKKIDSIVVIGGGDSASAAIKFGYKNAFTHISTGGGASLEYIEGRKLPGIECLSE